MANKSKTNKQHKKVLGKASKWEKELIQVKINYIVN